MFEIISYDELKARLDKFDYIECHFHHTFLPEGKDYDGTDASAMKLQQNMKNYHVNVNGWVDIGQHITLLPDGRFVTGRDFWKTPASILGYNTGAFCLEILGNFDIGHEVLKGNQKISALRLAKYFDDRMRYIRFHRENAAKTCPGSGLDKDVFMGQARGQVLIGVQTPILPHPGSEIIRTIQELCNEAGLRDKNGNTLKVDGLWGTKTESALPTLRKGGKVFKWIIRFMQKRLLEMGYSLPKYGADGNFGQETENAILRLQKDTHLVKDGVVGKLTWAYILKLK